MIKHDFAINAFVERQTKSSCQGMLACKWFNDCSDISSLARAPGWLSAPLSSVPSLKALPRHSGFRVSTFGLTAGRQSRFQVPVLCETTQLVPPQGYNGENTCKQWQLVRELNTLFSSWPLTAGELGLLVSMMAAHLIMLRQATDIHSKIEVIVPHILG